MAFGLLIELKAGPSGPLGVFAPFVFAGAFWGIIAVLHFFVSALPPGRFVEGYRAAGEVVEVTEDDVVDWLGNRRIRIETLRGPWVVETRTIRSHHMFVTPPGFHASLRVKGSARAAGRRAAQREGEFGSP